MVTFQELIALIKRMSVQECGAAYEALRENIVGHLVINGYSRERAEQVIDELSQLGSLD